MKFAKWVYIIAGIYGLLVVTPLYFSEAQIGRDYPPAITHPEFFYGFVGITVAWQLAFLLIGRDPVRYRPLMPVTWVEKFSFAIAALVLNTQGRMTSIFFAAAMIDLLLGVLFVIAFWRTSEQSAQRSDASGKLANELLRQA